jgi:nucleoside-diphosphate-sugar epimerase
MAKDVFITSGTGYVGEAVAQALKAKGYNVTALSRSEESALKLKKQGIKSHRGDITKPETFLDAAKQADIVIHTAQTKDPNFGKHDAQAVEALVNALAGTNKTFVYSSGTWVLGDTRDTVATEDQQTNPADLVRWRPSVEKTVIDSSKNGIRAIVLRPALVYGGDGGFIEQIIQQTKRYGEVQHIGSGENRWTFVHVDDLADLYVLAVEKGTAGKIYHGAHDKPVRVKDLSEQIAKAHGLPGKVRSIPVEEARQGLGGLADALTLDHQVDATKTKRELNWQPSRPTIHEFVVQKGRSLAGTTR